MNGSRQIPIRPKFGLGIGCCRKVMKNGMKANECENQKYAKMAAPALSFKTLKQRKDLLVHNRKKHCNMESRNRNRKRK